jgi:hypothetical protein
MPQADEPFCSRIRLRFRTSQPPWCRFFGESWSKLENGETEWKSAILFRTSQLHGFTKRVKNLRIRPEQNPCLPAKTGIDVAPPAPEALALDVRISQTNGRSA